MDKLVRIHASKQPRRPHFIHEWMLKRQMKPADLVREIGADKGQISRWLKGATPGTVWQEKLAGAFNCERDSLFRHPKDDWLNALFKRHQGLKELLIDRSEDDLVKIEKLIETVYPLKAGTHG